MIATGSIILTGGAGFIGCNCARELNARGRDDLIIVDHLDDPRKTAHLKGIRYALYFDRDDFLPALEQISNVEAVIHLGACTDTSVADEAYFMRYNVAYSRTLFEYCTAHNIRFIYASSAATYGDGSGGFEETKRDVRPLNAYGRSKHAFDEFVRMSAKRPPAWAGMKFFNVYGPYEDHKDAMASMVYQGYQQIITRGCLRLFRSTRPGFPDGSEERDFVYIKDVVDVMLFLLHQPKVEGIVNVGSGHARSFLDLAHALFRALRRPPAIEWFDMPARFRGAYQYHTQADLQGLRRIGYQAPFTSLGDGVADYVAFLQHNHAQEIS